MKAELWPSLVVGDVGRSACVGQDLFCVLVAVGRFSDCVGSDFG